MSQQFLAHAFIVGIGADETINVGAYAACVVDSIRVVTAGEIKRHRGTNGRTMAAQKNDEHLQMEITFKPVATTTKADARAKAIIPKFGTTFALSSLSTWLYAGVDYLNSTWVLIDESSVQIDAADPSAITCTLSHFLDNQTLMSTPVA